jgi:hypothetical protein
MKDYMIEVHCTPNNFYGIDTPYLWQIYYSYEDECDCESGILKSGTANTPQQAWEDAYKILETYKK